MANTTMGQITLVYRGETEQFKTVSLAARTEDVGRDGLLMDQYILEVAHAFKIGVLEYGLIAAAQPRLF